MKRPTREEQQGERDRHNALLRAYSYHWKRTEQLTDEQFHAAHLLAGEDDIPRWTLLSPLDMPVDETTILHWLGKHGSSGDDVLAFIADKGFVVEGKDERGIWHIRRPSGKETINLQQTLQALELMRIDLANAQRRAWEQKIQKAFKHSTTSLKEALDLYGKAQNAAYAWGYSPYPYAERLADGAIQVRTYHFEGEWRKDTFKTPEQVVLHLYANSDGTWNPGEWVKVA